MMENNANQVVVPQEFSTKSGLRTRALEVNGHVMWVCPQQLACQTPYFETLFFGPYFEADVEVVHLDETNIEGFIIFLKCVTMAEDYLELMNANYVVVLDMADKYMALPLVNLVFVQLRMSRHELPRVAEKELVTEIIDILIRDLFHNVR